MRVSFALSNNLETCSNSLYNSSVLSYNFPISFLTESDYDLSVFSNSVLLELNSDLTSQDISDNIP